MKRKPESENSNNNSSISLQNNLDQTIYDQDDEIIDLTKETVVTPAISSSGETSTQPPFFNPTSNTTNNVLETANVDFIVAKKVEFKFITINETSPKEIIEKNINDFIKNIKSNVAQKDMMSKFQRYNYARLTPVMEALKGQFVDPIIKAFEKASISQLRYAFDVLNFESAEKDINDKPNIKSRFEGAGGSLQKGIAAIFSWYLYFNITKKLLQKIDMNQEYDIEMSNHYNLFNYAVAHNIPNSYKADYVLLIRAKIIDLIYSKFANKDVTPAKLDAYHVVKQLLIIEHIRKDSKERYDEFENDLKEFFSRPVSIPAPILVQTLMASNTNNSSAKTKNLASEKLPRNTATISSQFGTTTALTTTIQKTTFPVPNKIAPKPVDLEVASPQAVAKNNTSSGSVQSEITSSQTPSIQIQTPAPTFTINASSANNLNMGNANIPNLPAFQYNPFVNPFLPQLSPSFLPPPISLPSGRVIFPSVPTNFVDYNLLQNSQLPGLNANPFAQVNLNFGTVINNNNLTNAFGQNATNNEQQRYL